MPLEQFKTQVLLLHSEQSTLDTLSAGFDDRYTVHCATSGSEALTTLGEVPIHVIVSAHKLPGMSGLDALREAQKRSPETIGILLTGSEGGDVEALVGEKDMFQVVREEVTPESLRQMIDRATQQARLMALAQSAANDTSANMDQPTGEHIVMETSENGSTIISDGTGRFPALNPAKISAEKAVGARAVGVIVLSQDEDFLRTVKDSARGSHDIYHATTISQADEFARKNKIGVAVIDAAMVGANVEKMTLHLRKTTSRLVAIVAGRRDDGDMLMDLINRGKVYRFLLKPVSPGRARLAIEASVKYHLEAPDAAFRIAASDSAAPAPAGAKPVRSKAVAPVRPEPGKTVPEPGPPSAGKDRAGTRAEPPRETRAAEEPRNELPEIDVNAPAPPAADADTPPAIEDLGNAFDDGGSIMKSMTGMFRARGDASAGDKASAGGAKPVGQDTGTGVAGLFRPQVLGTAAALLVAAAVTGWWLTGEEPEPPAATSAASTAPVETDAPSPGPRETAVAPEVPQEPPEPVIDLDEVLAGARNAVETGRIYAPDGDNAIDLYLAASAELPDNETVVAELAATVDRALGLAETALLQRETGEVPAILARVSAADPDNARLAFLEAQLRDVEVRLALADARLAIREQRFDEAAALLGDARSLGGTAPEEIETVAAELEQARIDQQVAAILEQAAARLDDGALVSPAGDSARHYYELALETDPANVAARQGLVAITSRLVLQALADIDARAFPEAERLLAEARAIAPESAELASAVEALAAEKEAVEQERLEAERLAAEKARAEREAAERAERERIAREREAAERAEQERLAREREAAEQAERERLAREREAAEQAERERLAREREAAEQAERERLAREREAAERAAQERAAAERAAAAARLAADAQPAPTRQAPARQAASPRPAPAETQAPARQPEPEPAGRDAGPSPVTQAAVAAPPAGQATGAPARAAEQNVAGPAAAAKPAERPAADAAPVERPVVPVSSLNRTRYVAPKYPRVAERRNQTGWVDIVLTVGTDGSVANVEVIASQPGDVFVDSAKDAVERWEFEPVMEDGEAIEQRAAVRMMFAIE